MPTIIRFSSIRSIFYFLFYNEYIKYYLELLLLFVLFGYLHYCKKQLIHQHLFGDYLKNH